MKRLHEASHRRRDADAERNHNSFLARDVWFSAWRHLKTAQTRLKKAEALETLGAKHGEKLSSGILHFGWPWSRTLTVTRRVASSSHFSRPSQAPYATVKRSDRSPSVSSLWINFLEYSASDQSRCRCVLNKCIWIRHPLAAEP
jgi:hypothetical protein